MIVDTLVSNAIKYREQLLHTWLFFIILLLYFAFCRMFASFFAAIIDVFAKNQRYVSLRCLKDNYLSYGMFYDYRYVSRLPVCFMTTGMFHDYRYVSRLPVGTTSIYSKYRYIQGWYIKVIGSTYSTGRPVHMTHSSFMTTKKGNYHRLA
jgi:hypothetical protein